MVLGARSNPMKRWRCSERELAKFLGCKRKTIRLICRRLGIKRRKKYLRQGVDPYTAGQVERILAEYYASAGKRLLNRKASSASVSSFSASSSLEPTTE